MNISQPIVLILDSGVGGLFVYDILQKTIPYVNYLYLLDNKFFPYGKRSKKFIIKRVIFVIETVYKYYRFNLVIIACNTISVVALRVLQAYFPFPVIGITPNIQLAARYTKNGVIGVLATYQTVRNNYTLNLIKYFAYQYQVILMDTSRLVKLAEYKVYGKFVSKFELMNILDPWLSLKKSPDTIVLGCTHFSLLKEEFKKILPANNYVIDFSSYSVSYIKYILKKYINIDKNNIFDYKEFKKNTAYYTMYTSDIVKLRSVLLRDYNFCFLEMLSV